jgi:hypothetical protein
VRDGQQISLISVLQDEAQGPFSDTNLGFVRHPRRDVGKDVVVSTYARQDCLIFTPEPLIVLLVYETAAQA